VGAVQFDDDGAVDLACFGELARHFEAGAREPLALAHAIRFPVKHFFVAEVRRRHFLVLFHREVGDKRTVRHKDDLTLVELFFEFGKIAVARNDDDLVDEREARVEALVERRHDCERVEPLVFGAFKDLKGGVAAESCDGEKRGKLRARLRAHCPLFATSCVSSRT
jgi:hypothetical protein